MAVFVSRDAFLPLWQDVAMQLAENDPKGKKKLVMGKFNCEQVGYVLRKGCFATGHVAPARQHWATRTGPAVRSVLLIKLYRSRGTMIRFFPLGYRWSFLESSYLPVQYLPFLNANTTYLLQLAPCTAWGARATIYGALGIDSRGLE